MISQKRFIAVFISITLIAIVLNASTFLVHGVEQVVVVRMGKIVRTINNNTGLYAKWPFIDAVIRLDRRTMSMNSSSIQVPTSGNEFITVTTATKWRISDPETFVRIAKSEAAGKTLLDQMLTASLRSHAATLTVEQIVGGNLSMINCEGDDSLCKNKEQSIGYEVAAKVREYGIKLEDFRVLRVSHSPNVNQEVENRMIAERINASESVTEEGEIESAKILAEADLQVQQIISSANKFRDNYLASTNQEIIERTNEIYRLDPEFYEFFVTIKAYQDSIGQNTTLMISTDSNFLKFLETSKYH